MLYARTNPVPLLDDRIKWLPVFFGGAVVVMAVLVFGVWKRLLRSKRLFDEGRDPLAGTA